MVVTGNAVAELVGTVLIPLMTFLDLEWVLENPQSSLFFNWPTVNPWLSQPSSKSIGIDLQNFGCLCPKSLSFKGTWSGLPILKLIETALKALLGPEDFSDEKASQQSGRWGINSEHFPKYLLVP